MSPIPNFEENKFANNYVSNWNETNDNEKLYNLNDNKTVETMEGKSVNFELSADDVFPEDDKAMSNESTVHRVQSVNVINDTSCTDADNLSRDESSDALAEARVTSSLTQIANIDPEICGMPLGLFTKVIIVYINYFM